MAALCSSWRFRRSSNPTCRAGRQPEFQVNIDATAMLQASIGASYIQNIISSEVSSFLQRSRGTARRAGENRGCARPSIPTATPPGSIASSPSSTKSRMLTIILTGAALLREREHGTIEHLLVMPLTAFEIAMAKVWANGLVILVAVTASLFFVVRSILARPDRRLAGAVHWRAWCCICSSPRRWACFWEPSRGRWPNSRC